MFEPNMSEAAASAVGEEFEISYRNGRLFATVNENASEQDTKSILRGFPAGFPAGDKPDPGSSLPAFGVLAALAATAIFILVLAVIIGKLRNKNQPSDDSEEEARRDGDKGVAANQEKKAASNEQDEKLTTNFPTGMPSMMEKMKRRLFPHRHPQQDPAVSTINVPKEHLQEIFVF